MSPLTTRIRQAPWLPGAVIIAIAVTISAAVGQAFGARSWLIYVFIAVLVLLLLGGLERLWARGAAPPRPRARGKLKVLQGGKTAPYDLEKDNSTDSQRYLM